MARNRVKRFLENLHLRVIVLAEQPDESKTVIEKFEANADVGYAVILLTGDDWGALNGRGRTQGLKQSHRVESRARQNGPARMSYSNGDFFWGVSVGDESQYQDRRNPATLLYAKPFDIEH
jgi:hypothetical protein